MNAPIDVPADHHPELLAELLTRRAAVILSLRSPEGWQTFKSHLLAIDEETGELILPYPSASQRLDPKIVGGQNVGVSFRRGHKKFVFNTFVLGTCRHETHPGTTVRALSIARPEALYELQRRLFHRSPVPRGTAVSVDVWRGIDEHDRPTDAQIHRGRMIDVSAGGISLVLPRAESLRLETGDSMVCTFTTDANDHPLELCTRLRCTDVVTDDRVRVGLQFVGLEASDEGRSKLRRLVRLATKFQRKQARHRRRG